MLNKIKLFLYNRLFQWLSYREIRNKIFITLLILIVFRFLANIPIPGIDPGALKNAFSGVRGIFDSIDILSGGTLSRLSIISIGLGAYINASIIFQLLGTIVKRIENLQKEGESGRAKINQWTRFLTVPLASLQAFGIYNLLRSDGLIATDLSNLQVATIVLVATAGAMVLMWLGELMTQQGLGNGISIIIMVGILAKIPGELFNLFTNNGFNQPRFTNPRDYIMFGTVMVAGIGAILLTILLYRFIRIIKQKYLRISLYTLLTILITAIPLTWIYQTQILNVFSPAWLKDALNFVNTVIFKPAIIPADIILGVTVVILAIISFNEATRKIPVQFARRFKSNRTVVLNNTHLPYRLLLAGVVPIIFASSFLYLPTILYFFFNNSNILWLKDFVVNMNTFLSNTRWEYWAIYFGLIFIFTYFYTLTVAFRPKNIAESLRKQGSFIPGVRPGPETEKYLAVLTSKLTFIGAVFLGFISVLPFFVSNIPGLGGVLASGTSSIIVVSVILDLRRQIAALRASQNYSKFIEE